MPIPAHSTILAPGTLHLPFYEKILSDQGNCLHTRVLTLEAYIAQNMPQASREALAVLYHYKSLLEDLPSSNSFYDSRQDYDFLNACHQFLGLTQLYGIDSFPSETGRQKDLKAILEILNGFKLWQYYAKDLVFEQASSVQIVKSSYSLQQQFFVNRLLEQGASELKTPSRRRVYSWSASNTRKEMEIAAQTILDQNLDAQQVFVALANPADKRVLAQIFTSRNIPFTFLHPSMTSPVLKMWKSVLSYLLEPDTDKLIQLLKTLYPQTSGDVVRFVSLFPEGSNLEELNYEENPVVSQADFEQFVSLERQASGWKEVIGRIKSWDYTSVMEIGNAIQEAILNPTEEDFKTFDGVISAYASVADSIRCNEDLSLFKAHLDTLHPSGALSEMKGVLVGSPAEITGLRKTAFFIGADASAFPGYFMFTGIFDEEYVASMGFPSLTARLETQKTNLTELLSLPEELYVLCAQSDYEGKTLEPSHELASWIGMPAKFQNIKDLPPLPNQRFLKPDFTLSSQNAASAMAPNNTLKARIGSLQSYDTCPFQHLMKYGLHLKTPYILKDSLKVRADILRVIMMEASGRFQTPFTSLPHDQMAMLVKEQFAFPRKVFLHKQKALDILEQEYLCKLEQMQQILRPLANRWNLNAFPEEYFMDIQEKEEDLSIEISGALALPSSRKVSLNLYPETPPAFDCGTPMPQASLSLSLTPPCIKQNAFKVSYGRGASPVQAIPLQENALNEDYLKEFIGKSMIAQNLQEPQNDPVAEYASKKIDTYQHRQEQTVQLAKELAQSIRTGCLLPEHKNGSCTFCPYQSICRNGKKEK